MTRTPRQGADDEWISFPGGELQGKRPKALCPACRQRLKRAATRGHQDCEAGRPRTLCFQCYRAELDRERALAAAGRLDTGSQERFQFGLPFEPVNRGRLAMLKAERASSRAAAPTAASRDVDRRPRAQIEARHALQHIAAGLEARRLARAERDRVMASAIHAAELQLPEAWLPFVVSR